MESNSFINSLEFLSDPFLIKAEDKITVIRYNNDCNTPFNHVNRSTWDYGARAVRTDNCCGVYGFTEEQVSLGQCSYFYNAFWDSVTTKSPIRFLKLEVDKTKVFYMDSRETVFSEANIVKELSLPELAEMFPQYANFIRSYINVSNDFDGESRFRSELNDAFHSREYLTTIDRIVEPLHGIAHGIRVERNARMICMYMGINSAIMHPFAFLHDFCRENDGEDPEHGLRALKHIEKHSEFFKYHFALTDTELNLLKYACEHHTGMLKSDIDIVNACFDADRLDIVRTGTTLNPNYMATMAGELIAKKDRY
jgi:uncharacterized protein